MKHDRSPIAAEGAAAAPAPDPTRFDPVPVRARHDGWTPSEQREFIEVLADTGLVREAAARVGMTEQSASRLRRRADARAFDIAWDAALRQGARRLHAIAWERAIEGSVRGHYYHGELVSEERVFDNRLLTWLLDRTEARLTPERESARVLRDWDGWMAAIERGEPPPKPPAPDKDEKGGAAGLRYYLQWKPNL